MEFVPKTSKKATFTKIDCSFMNSYNLQTHPWSSSPEILESNFFFEVPAFMKVPSEDSTIQKKGGLLSKSSDNAKNSLKTALKNFQTKRLTEDPIASSNSKQTPPFFDYQNDLSLKVEAISKTIRSPSEIQSLPVMVSLQAKDMPIPVDEMLSVRPGIDLVCVIDVSGSMDGEKIKLVQRTLKSLLSLMTTADRISLITFNSKVSILTDFKSVISKNMPLLTEIIDSLETHGGTNIDSGLMEAMKQIQQRKFKNTIVSMFLLSDGMDQNCNAWENIKETLKRDGNGVILNTFGYGNLHDAELMRASARMCGGNFYFVDEIGRIQDFFIDAISLLFSIVLYNIEISVTSTTNLKISKTYGEMWTSSDTTSQKSVKSSFFSRCMTKNYICELTMSNDSLEETPKSIVLDVTMNGITLTNTKITKKVVLELNFQENDSENTANSEVVVNYLRVLGAEKLDLAKNLSNQGEFPVAQQEIRDFLEKIKACPYKDHAYLRVLRSNLEKTSLYCRKKVYNNEKKAYISAFSQNHMFQQSSATNSESETFGDVYSTYMQVILSSSLTTASKPFQI